jgi:hypothetical protein
MGHPNTLTIPQIWAPSSQEIVSPRKSLTRQWLLCREHRSQFRL